MSEEKKSIMERAAEREAAAALRRDQVTGLWLSIKDDDPFAEHHYRRMFAMEILLNGADELHPRVGSFLGQSAVDRNAYTLRQREYLSNLVCGYLGIDPQKPDPKTKKAGCGK